MVLVRFKYLNMVAIYFFIRPVNNLAIYTNF